MEMTKQTLKLVVRGRASKQCQQVIRDLQAIIATTPHQTAHSAAALDANVCHKQSSFRLDGEHFICSIHSGALFT